MSLARPFKGTHILVIRLYVRVVRFVFVFFRGLEFSARLEERNHEITRTSITKNTKGAFDAKRRRHLIKAPLRLIAQEVLIASATRIVSTAAFTSCTRTI